MKSTENEVTNSSKSSLFSSSQVLLSPESTELAHTSSADLLLNHSSLNLSDSLVPPPKPKNKLPIIHLPVLAVKPKVTVKSEPLDSGETRDDSDSKQPLLSVKVKEPMQRPVSFSLPVFPKPNSVVKQKIGPPAAFKPKTVVLKVKSKSSSVGVGQLPLPVAPPPPVPVNNNLSNSPSRPSFYGQNFPIPPPPPVSSNVDDEEDLSDFDDLPPAPHKI
jgi:hypothetical protein